MCASVSKGCEVCVLSRTKLAADWRAVRHVLLGAAGGWEGGYVRNQMMVANCRRMCLLC